MRAAALLSVTTESTAIVDVVKALRRSRQVAEVIAAVPDPSHLPAGSGREGQGDPGHHGLLGLLATAERAEKAGAHVIHATGSSREHLTLSALARTESRAILLIDPDLRGLLSHHIHSLVSPIADSEAAMVCGLIDSGPVLNRLFLNFLPVLTRQRCLRRELLDGVNERSLRRESLESALNRLALRKKLPTHTLILEGVWIDRDSLRAAPALPDGLRAATRALEYVSYPVRNRMPRLPRLIDSLSGQRSPVLDEAWTEAELLAGAAGEMATGSP